MKKAINTLKELIDYVNVNFDKLSDENFQKLLNTTLFIYPLRKPETKEEAIKMIEKWGVVPVESRPLFPDIQNFDNYETD